MSQFTEISKQIGWEGEASIPTIDDANELLRKVRKHDLDAFIEVFSIHRFAPLPNHKDHVNAMEIVWKAWIEGMRYFDAQRSTRIFSKGNVLMIIALLTTLTFTSCKKGLIFDKEMVIGEWKSWELYDYPHEWKWSFTEDSVKIYRDSLGLADSLIYEQAGWNTKTFDIHLFPAIDPVDSIGNPNWFIDIAKYHRTYLVLSNESDNHSFTLTKIN